MVHSTAYLAPNNGRFCMFGTLNSGGGGGGGPLHLLKSIQSG